MQRAGVVLLPKLQSSIISLEQGDLLAGKGYLGKASRARLLWQFLGRALGYGTILVSKDPLDDSRKPLTRLTSALRSIIVQTLTRSGQQ